jgi:hypothetical protein
MILHLQDRRSGIWQDRIAGEATLEGMRTQMDAIDSYRGTWPQRILDDAGNVLAINAAGEPLRDAS